MFRKITLVYKYTAKVYYSYAFRGAISILDFFPLYLPYKKEIFSRRLIGRVERYAVSIIMATKGFTWGKDRK